jgi:hypothetical protein
MAKPPNAGRELGKIGQTSCTNLIDKV